MYKGYSNSYRNYKEEVIKQYAKIFMSLGLPSIIYSDPLVKDIEEAEEAEEIDNENNYGTICGGLDDFLKTDK